MLVPKFEPLGKTRREFLAVSHHDQNGLSLLMNVEQHVRHDVCGFLIKVSSWLVTQQELWLHDQRARQSDPLFLAAGKLRGTVIEAFGEPDLFQQFSGPLRWFAVHWCNHSWRQHILDHGALRQQAVVLEHKPDLLIAKRSELFGVEQEWILAF